MSQLNTESNLKDFIINGVHVKYLGNKDIDEYEAETFCGFEIDDSYVELYEPLWQMTINGEVVYIREGVWCEWDEDGYFEPDWSLTWFYKNKEHPEDHFYFEQDGIEVSIHNLLTILEAQTNNDGTDNTELIENVA